MDLVSRNEAKQKGLARYYTGKPCRHGHVSERQTSDRDCIECRRARSRINSKKYRDKNLSVCLKKSREHYQANKEHIKQKRREKYAKNITAEREASRLRARATYVQRRDKMVVYLREYYAANKDDFSERARAWREANPEKCKQYHVNRKAKLKKAEGSFDAGDIGRMMESQNCMCSACGDNLDDTGFHVDHVVPLAKGGSNWPSNLQLLCPPCNLGKGTKSNEEWLATLTG